MERLQKILARAGIASRRAAEQIILAGRVRVDGRIVRELGTQVDERKSRVEVDGTKIVAEKLVYIVLHKPRGVVCTLSDPEGRPTIRELLKDAGARVVPVGRLDFHTSGALLCTNDGEFAQALAHPKREVPKVYVAKVKGTVEDDALESFGESIEIDGRSTRPAQVKRLRFEGDKTWLEITLREGRNRQVRRLGEAKGFPVMRLARISHAGVSSEDLRPGQWRPLSVEELVDLKKDFGVPKKVRAPQLALVETAKRENKNPRPQHGGRTRKTVRGRTQDRSFEADPEIQGARFSRTRGSFETEADRETRFSNQRPQRGGEARSSLSSRKDSFGDQRRQPAGGSRVPNRKAPFADERPQRGGGARVSSRKGPSADERRQPGGGARPSFSSRKAPFADERSQSAGGARFSSRKAPFADERSQSAGGARFSSRKGPLQGERAQSARHEDLNRPRKNREKGPATNSARPSADRGAGRKSRRT